MCHRTGTGTVVGPEGWKRKGDLVQDNIKMDLEEIERVGGTDWIDVAQDGNRYPAVVNTVMNVLF